MEAMTDYFRTLERYLDCPRAVRGPFLARTRQMAEDFFQNRPGATPEEAADYLGDPRELAWGFLETLDPSVVEHHRKRKKFFLYGCIAALVVALAAVAVWGVILWSAPSIEITEKTIIYSERTLP